MGEILAWTETMTIGVIMLLTILLISVCVYSIATCGRFKTTNTTQKSTSTRSPEELSNEDVV